MAFVVKKNFSLDFLGEGWQAAYINFSLPSLEESLQQASPSQEEIEADPKKYTLEMVSFLEEHFIDGKGFNGSQLVDLEKEDIKRLPTSVFAKATQLLSGAVDPNS
jgi:hypothetical protein